jgi:transposase
MTDVKYVGMDVHSATTMIEVQNETGKVIGRSIIETKPEHFRDFFSGLSGIIYATFEEGCHAAWLYDLIKPKVADIIVCNPRAIDRKGKKSDKIDTHQLTQMLRLGALEPVYHGDISTRYLKEVVRCYDSITRDRIRVMNRIKAIYRSRAIPCKGTEVYRPNSRRLWISKLGHDVSLVRLELLYQQMDFLSDLRKKARSTLISNVRRLPAYKILMNVPALGPIRIAFIIAIVSTPFLFRTKRQFWPYCGLEVVTVSSADYQMDNNGIRRSKKPIGTRGLNRNYNRALKQVFKAAATAAKSRPPFKQYYDQMIARNVKPEIARVALARKIAAITLAIWKKGEDFDPNKLIVRD